MLLLALPLACTNAPTPTDGPPSADPLPVEQARLSDDITLLAVPRPPGSQGWQAAQDLCAQRFTDLGYEVELHTFPTGTNVLGRKPGTTGHSTVVVSAHYDSVPACDGADDNATGVAAVLELARALADTDLDDDVLFACWDREEAGLVGSEAWVQGNTGDVSMAYSLETIGFTDPSPNSQSLPFGFDLLFPTQIAEVEANENRGDFIAWIGTTDTTEAANAFESRAAELDLPTVDLLITPDFANNPMSADLQRSDHASFWAEGHPAVMITDTADFRNPGYHCYNGPDRVDSLDLAFVTLVTEATRASIVASANR